MAKKWRIVVAFIFDDEGDTKAYHVNGEVDVSLRVLDRVLPAIGGIVGDGKTFAEYAVISEPKAVIRD
jgi:hypothetical protein